jgi:hypothetical protein
MHRTAARPWASMGRAISITASFWVWDRGRTGVTATVGASIASAGVEEEGTLASAEMAADGLMRVTVDAGHRGHAATTVAPAPERPVAALLMVRRVAERRVAQLRTAALLTAVDRMAAADRMAAVSTTNPQHLLTQESQAAKHNSFAAFACCCPVAAAVLDAYGINSCVSMAPPMDARTADSLTTLWESRAIQIVSLSPPPSSEETSTL